MTTVQMRSVGPVRGGPARLTEELREAAAVMQSPKLVLLYLPIDVDHDAYLRAAAAIGVPVVGATTGGAAFTERGWTRRDPVAAILGGEQAAFEVQVVQDLRAETIDKIGDAAAALVRMAKARRVLAPSILTLCDAFACDGDALVDALRRATPPHWRLFGGTAGDNWTFRGTKVFAHGEAMSAAAVLVGIFAATPPALDAHHGFFPAEGGRSLRVTEIRGNVLVALDGRPAAAVYKEELTRLELWRPGEDLVATMAKYELGVKTAYGEALQIRAPLGVRDDGSVVLASSLRDGSIVRVMAADPDSLIMAAAQLAQRTYERLGEEVCGALVFDCAARLQLLGDRYPAQVAAFVGDRDFPCVGMTCYGEIAKFGGSVEGFHNTTATLAAW